MGLGPRLATSRDTTPRPMGRRSEPTRRWRLPCDAWPPANPHPGAYTYPGWNTLSTQWWVRPPVCPRSSALWDTSPPFFPRRRGRWQYPRSGSFSVGVGASGRRPGTLCSTTKTGSSASPTDGGYPPLPIVRDKGYSSWLLAKDLPLPTLSWILAPRYVSPYTIERVVNPSALRLPPSLKVHPVFHVSQVKPVAVSTLSPPGPTPPPPWNLESGDLVWEVSWILAVHRRGLGGVWTGGPLMGPSVVLRKPELIEGFLQGKPSSYRTVARGLP